MKCASRVAGSMLAMACTGSASAQIVDDQPHPAMTSDGSWAGVLLIIVAALLVAAMMVGIAVRLNQPED